MIMRLFRLREESEFHLRPKCVSVAEVVTCLEVQAPDELFTIFEFLLGLLDGLNQAH